MGAGSGPGLDVTVGLGRELKIVMLNEATISGRRRGGAVILILVPQPLSLSPADFLTRGQFRRHRETGMQSPEEGRRNLVAGVILA
jgi:hypothetical protein